jgi:hypothetical protein
MRLIWAALLAAAMGLAGCGNRGGEGSLTVEEQQTVTGGVRHLMTDVAQDVTKNGPIAWRSHFEDVPSFFMAVNGQMMFSDSQSVTQGIQNVARMFKHIDLTWGEVRVDPLSSQFASVASPYHETITTADDQVLQSDGFFTALAEKRDGQWQFRNVHWSVPVPAAVPTPTAKEH